MQTGKPPLLDLLPHQVLIFIEEHMKEIPHKRLSQIEKTIDGWVGQGKGRSEIFAELNKLLQTEFLGGRVNNNELKHGITVKEKVTVTFDQDYEGLENSLNALGNVLDVRKLEERKYLIRFQESNSNLKKLLDYFSRHGINFLEVYNELPSLNDVFFELTGKELRE